MKIKLLVGALWAALYILQVSAGMPIVNVEFTDTLAPMTTTQMQSAYTTSSAVVTYANGEKAIFPLSYQTLYNSGDQIGGWRAGTVVDRNGQPLQTAQVDESGTIAQGPFYAKAPDANSLLKEGNSIFLVTHFEYDTEAPNIDPSKPVVDLYGKLPMVMNLAGISQNQHTGLLSAKDLKNIDMSAVAGLWIPCAGELTPWNTHIGGEEYEPDARVFEAKPLTPMNLFLGKSALTATQGGANPYRYGLATEVEVDKHGETEVVKHYAMGRLANELAHIMPDGKTAYKGDDGQDVVLTMFVADKKTDLSSGTLYAAKLEQVDAANGGKFNLNWIKLGHASDSEIDSMVENGIKFSDIFEVVNKSDYMANPAAYDGFKPVYVYTGTGGKTQLEYLKIKSGMEKAAAFLETRRYAAYLGATTEFTKMEGEASNKADKKLYVAMSYVQKGMLEGQNGERPQDDIHLAGDPKDLSCGVVYESNLKGGQKDTAGEMIRSRWVATDMQALLTGAKKPADQTAYGKYDKCDTDKMANPDNIKYSEALRALFVGEDSGNHLNNFLWAHSVASGKLTRIATNRAAAEWTGLQSVDDMNGYAYIMSNIQHPGAADDLSQYKAVIPNFDAFRAGIDQRGTVGYLQGLPAVKHLPGKVEDKEDGSNEE
jgi:secreted PhoX family phosphatase